MNTIDLSPEQKIATYEEIRHLAEIYRKMIREDPFKGYSSHWHKGFADKVCEKIFGKETS